jgi:hypothetical protein
MRPWILAVAMLVSLFVLGAVVAIGLPSGHVDRYACPTGADLSAHSCADAEKHCAQEGPGGSATSADGDGFSYGYECEDGVLTSFTFT